MKTFGKATVLGVALAGCLIVGGGLRNAAGAAARYAGTIKIEVALSAGPNLPDGTSVDLNISASPNDTTFNEDASFSETTKVSAGKLKATILIPYRWIITDTSDPVTVSLYAYGQDVSGPAGVDETRYLTQTFTIPASGTVTTVEFCGTL